MPKPVNVRSEHPAGYESPVMGLYEKALYQATIIKKYLASGPEYSLARQEGYYVAIEGPWVVVANLDWDIFVSELDLDLAYD